MSGIVLILALSLTTLGAVAFFGLFELGSARQAQKKGKTTYITNYSRRRRQEKLGRRVPPRGMPDDVATSRGQARHRATRGGEPLMHSDGPEGVRQTG